MTARQALTTLSECCMDNDAPPRPYATERDLETRVLGLSYHRHSGAWDALMQSVPAEGSMEGPTTPTASVPAAEHPVRLVREPDNEHDPNALAVLVDESMLGYLPRAIAQALSPLLESDAEDMGPAVAVVGAVVRPGQATNASMPITLKLRVLDAARASTLPLEEGRDEDRPQMLSAEETRVLLGEAPHEGRAGLRVLSLFDGIGAAYVALRNEGIPVVSDDRAASLRVSFVH
jgi:hypothetical protein